MKLNKVLMRFRITCDSWPSDLQLTSQDHTPQVIRRALEKHNMEDVSCHDFTLCQMLNCGKGNFIFRGATLRQKSQFGNLGFKATFRFSFVTVREQNAKQNCLSFVKTGTVLMTFKMKHKKTPNC